MVGIMNGIGGNSALSPFESGISLNSAEGPEFFFETDSMVLFPRFSEGGVAVDRQIPASALRGHRRQHACSEETLQVRNLCTSFMLTHCYSNIISQNYSYHLNFFILMTFHPTVSYYFMENVVFCSNTK